MARIKLDDKARTMDFMKLAATASLLGEKNDCAVKAVAIVTGRPDSEVRDAFSARGRKEHKGVWTPMIYQVVNDLGFAHKRVDPTDLISWYPKPHDKLKSVTTHHPVRFKESWDHVIKDKSLLLFTNGHVGAYKGRIVHDHTRGRPCRVISMVEVYIP